MQKNNFFPVLLTTAYNETQADYLVNLVINGVIQSFVTVDRESIKKIDYIWLSPEEARMIWQRQFQETKIKRINPDDSIIVTLINIRGLLIDKYVAYHFLKIASEEIDTIHPLHTDNIPSLSKLSKYNTPNKYGIQLNWKEVADLKKKITSENASARASRIKTRFAFYMKNYAHLNPSKKLIIEIIHAQENLIRKELGIPENNWPSISTYERDERDNPRDKIKKS